MDLDREKRIRTIKVIVADLLIVTVVVPLVAVLVAVVIGYRVDTEKFSVKQEGLVQIDSVPTGARVAIDGEDELFGQTNVSKMLSGGEHEIVLQKAGYTSWKKTVSIVPGWLRRVQYPRLFKKKREKLDVFEFGSAAPDFFYAAPDRKKAVFSTGGSTKWHLLTGMNGEVKDKTIDVSGIFSAETKDGDERRLTAVPDSVTWDDNSTLILVSLGGERAVIDPEDASESINLSRELERFRANAEEVRENAEDTDSDAKKPEKTDAANSGVRTAAVLAADDAQEIRRAEFASAGKVIADVGGKLLLISLSERTATDTIIEDAADLQVFEDEIVYITNKNEAGESEIRLYHLGDKRSILAAKVKDDARAAIGVYSGQAYLAYYTGGSLTVLRAEDFPRAGQKISYMVKIWSKPVDVRPDDGIALNPTGAAVLLRSGETVLAFDNEMEQTSKFRYKDAHYSWADGNLLAGTSDGALTIRDFDGANELTLVRSGVVSGCGPLISGNNKYLYYTAKTDEGKFVLRRETIL